MKLLDRLKGERGQAVPCSPPPAAPDDPIRIPSIFVLGTGRCGTHFLEAIMRDDPAVYAVHTDSVNATADSFLRYALWNDLPVDLGPAREFRRRLIIAAGRDGKIYFESNAYLSLVARHLHQWYGAHLILLIRRPQDVVNSHLVKGWYADEPLREDVALAPGFSPDMQANHLFGRILPKGEEYRRWCSLTRVGRVSWWVNTLNLEVLRQLQTLPEKDYRVVRVEDLDYNAYLDLRKLFEGGQPLDEKRFEAIRRSRPGKGKRKKTTAEWSDQEWTEFLAETSELHEAFGYRPSR